MITPAGGQVMASGRPDYWYGMLPGQSVFLENQTPWYVYNSVMVGYKEGAAVITYTVPENRLLYLSGGFIGSSYPGERQMQLNIDFDIVFRARFSDVFVIPIAPSAGFYLTAGQMITLNVVNPDNYGDVIEATLFGYLEEVT